MTNTVIANGHTYTDDSDPTTGMGNGGHRIRLLPMLSDVMIETGNDIAAAAASAAAAAASEANADIQAGEALLSAAAADTASVSASISATSASGSATAAAASAASAAALAGAYMGTSTSLVSIGSGNKTFTTQAGELYSPGIWMIAVSQANTANFMAGQVVSYSGTTLVIDVTITGGSGIFADWNLSLSGTQGVQGPQGAQGPAGSLTGGNLLGLLAELKAANITAASTTNVWAATGNSATLVGTTPITSFGTAPQAGAKFTLVAGAVTPITHGANLALPGLANYTTAVGDRLEIYAETTTQMRVSIFKVDGRPVSGAISAVGSTITTDTTLTAASAGYQFVQMATLGKSVSMPAANTLAVGGPLYLLDNTKGSYPAGIRDNAGTLIGAVAPGGEALVSLKDSSTVAGVWSVTGSGLEPGLLTMSTRLSSFVAVLNSPVQFVALDANVSIHFAYWSANSFYAFVVDNTGKTVPTPISVTAGGGPLKAVFRISATQAIVFYGTGATDHKAVVLTLTGSSPTYSLSVGTPATSTTNLGEVWGGDDFLAAPSIAQLTSTLYLVAGANTSGSLTTAIALSVSGSTITLGTPLTSIQGGPQTVTLYPLTATTALLIVTTSGSTHATVLSVSGTTVTNGSVVTVTGIASSVAGPQSSVLLSPTKALITGYAGNNVSVAALTVSGTVVTAGTASLVYSGADGIEYKANASGRYSPHLWAIGPNTAGIWVKVSGDSCTATSVLTESGGVVTVNPLTYGTIATRSAGGVGAGQMLTPGATEFLSVRQSLSGTAGFGLQVVPSKISGTTITSGAGETLRDALPMDPYQFLMGKLSGGDYALIPWGVTNTDIGMAGSTKLVVMRSNGDRVTNRGAISIPEIWFPRGNPSYASPIPLPNVSASRFVLVGGAFGTASGAPNANLLQVLNVEIAA